MANILKHKCENSYEQQLLTRIGYSVLPRLIKGKEEDSRICQNNNEKGDLGIGHTTKFHFERMQELNVELEETQLALRKSEQLLSEKY